MADPGLEVPRNNRELIARLMATIDAEVAKRQEAQERADAVQDALLQRAWAAEAEVQRLREALRPETLKVAIATATDWIWCAEHDDFFDGLAGEYGSHVGITSAVLDAIAAAALDREGEPNANEDD